MSFKEEIESLDKDALLEKKVQVDQNLSIYRTRLQDARADHAKGREGLPESAYRDLVHKVASLGRLSQILQLELRQRKLDAKEDNKARTLVLEEQAQRNRDAKKQRAMTFERAFVDTAKRLLDETTFDAIQRDALAAVRLAETPR